LVVLLLVFALDLDAQSKNSKTSFNKKEIEQYIKTTMLESKIPGLTYAVVMNGKMIDSGAYGYANVELNAPVSLHTKFNLGSIGKTFTATGIMLLVKQGKISLSDPITKYFDSLPDTWKQISIERLLSHTSGIKDYVGDFPGYALIEKRDRKLDYSEREFIRMAAELPLNFTPGERFAYSNSNFVILGFLIHKVSGKTLPEFMKENVFDPLGMNETVYMSQKNIIPNRARGYLLDNKGNLINGNYISEFFSSTGDMGVTTTATDMVKWSLALNSGKVLDQPILDKMWTPVQLNNGESTNFFGPSYGLGWHVADYRGYKEVGHGGSFMNGYTANYVRFPELDLTLILLANLNPSEVGRMAYRIAGLIHPALSGFDQTGSGEKGDKGSVDEVNQLMKGIITGKLDTTFVTAGFIKRINPITASVMGDTSHIPPITFVYSDLITGRKVSRYGTSIKKIEYYKLQLPDETAYMALYRDANNRIVDWRTY